MAPIISIYPVHRKVKPLQGSQLEIDLFGDREKVGFYNTFAAGIPVTDCAYDFAILEDQAELMKSITRQGMHWLQKIR